MNFALWLEKKDIELYESILNEMERRQFLQAGLAGLAGLAGSKAEAAPPKEESSRKKEITIKPMTASLQDDSPKGKLKNF
jgi:secreted PhoX family phosphatase